MFFIFFFFVIIFIIKQLCHEKNIYMGKGKWINVREVNGGWIHACDTLDDAKSWLKKNHHLFNHNKKQPIPIHSYAL